MFTGIVETTAAVMERTESRLTLARPSSFTDVKLGSSIAVNGVCLLKHSSEEILKNKKAVC